MRVSAEGQRDHARIDLGGRIRDIELCLEWSRINICFGRSTHFSEHRGPIFVA